jgi:hypothetical protein
LRWLRRIFVVRKILRLRRMEARPDYAPVQSEALQMKEKFYNTRAFPSRHNQFTGFQTINTGNLMRQQEAQAPQRRSFTVEGFSLANPRVNANQSVLGFSAPSIRMPTMAEVAEFRTLFSGATELR